MVWCAIWRHGNGSDQGCWASVDRLSKVSRIGRDRTRIAIKWLKQNNWLVAEERPGYTTRYLCTLEGGKPESDGALRLNAEERAPLLDTRTPPGSQGGNNIPMNKIPTASCFPVFLTKYLQTLLQTSFAALLTELCEKPEPRAQRHLSGSGSFTCQPLSALLASPSPKPSRSGRKQSGPKARTNCWRHWKLKWRTSLPLVVPLSAPCLIASAGCATSVT